MGMSVDEHRVLDVVGQVYDAAANAARLKAIGSLIAGEVGSSSALVFMARRNSAQLVQLVSASSNFDARASAAYRDYYHDRNAWFLRGAKRQPGFVGYGSDLIGYSEFERTEFCCDWCPQVGIYHLLAATFPVTDDIVGAIGIHRPREADAFDRDNQRFLAAVVPHLMRALQISYRLETGRRDSDLTLDVLHGLGVGVLLLDAELRPLFVNAVAERQMGSARWLTLSSGRIRTVHPKTMSAFERAVQDACAASAGESCASGGIIRLRDRFASSLAVLVTPFRAISLKLGPRQPAAAVIFSDPDERPALLATTIAESYGLTPAEGKLAAALTGGHSLPSYAREAHVSVNTAKTQLSSIFQKTGYQNQSALVGAILANPLVRLGSKSIAD